MNTIFITLAIITLVFIVVIQYTNNVKLTRKVNDWKDHATLMEVQRQDIVKITKSFLLSLLDENGNFPTDRIPFARVDTFINDVQGPLDSIRFRLKDGKVLTYLNGIINPTEEKVILNNVASLTDDQITLIYAFLEAIQAQGWNTPIIPLTPQKIKHFLTYKNS